MENLVEERKNTDVVPKPQYASLTDGYQTALQVVDDVILKNYIMDLSHMEIVPLNESDLQFNIRDNVRFFKITEMVYEKEEFATYKFASVFNALSMTDSAIFIIIDSDGIKTDFYMGVRYAGTDKTIASLRDTVENAMKGQFPGIKTVDTYTVDEMKSILDKIKADSISAVSCVANSKDHNNTNQGFVQGLEKFVLSMQGEKYTGIILANGTTQTQLRELRKGYETVYTQLSTFAETQVNYASNNAFNYAVAETTGNSQATTHTDNWSTTDTQSQTKGTADSHTDSCENAAGKTIKGVASAASLLGAALAPVTGGASLAVGGVVSGGIGMLGSVITKSVSDSTSTNESVTESFSTMNGSSDGTTDTVNYGISKTEGYTKELSEGMTLTLHDKSVENILERIDKQLKRMDEFESLGMYECAAYFLSDDSHAAAAEIAATTYKALMRGENSGVEVAAINSWGPSQKANTQEIEKYVKNFIHPVFRYNGSVGNIEVTPCSLVSGNELAIHMGLPRHSVCGLPVIEHADFGKEVVTYDGRECSNSIRLGNIFNMGGECSSKVLLDKDSLTMHTFVTGSTGSGKSNTIYKLVQKLEYSNVSYLIIEPAKGEYKNIFGHQKGVCVLGTNPQYTELLRINPFKFPKGIHVLEHIDRLVEIFNVCWPMYAAMPAVLKDALLQSYQSCGWDLSGSTNRYSKELFPTFTDLLNELVDVINHSAYSEEVKSNYTGSLVTRVKSLTNGLNGQIFTANEIDNAKLFDGRVIVDISRVGSSETKSLIMGILVMRLSEHRMSNCKERNASLHHVTVLEEAHNILKRVSTEQNEEGSNIAGKSVEMLSNAIAEMRTYGEGFIIADQSPSAVDISAIRNTNTKIIMRLPDEQDRRLAGKSAGLRDNQLDEIAKLPQGVAVVYQNDWIEPVLCKIGKFEGDGKVYEYSPRSQCDESKKANSTLINFVLKNRLDSPDVIDLADVEQAIEKSECSVHTKIRLYSLLEAYRQSHDLKIWKEEGFAEQAGLARDILRLDSAVDYSRQASSDWIEFNCFLNTLVSQKLDRPSDDLVLSLSHCLIKAYGDSAEKVEFYREWYDELAERGHLL